MISSHFLSDYSENKHFFHGHTYTGHPVGCSAAIANIRLYKKQNLISRIRTNSIYFRNRLKEIQASSIVGRVVHKGFLGALDLVINNEKKEHPIQMLNDHGNRIRPSYFIMEESLKMGVFIRSLGSTIVVIPPLAICKKDFAFLLDVIYEITQKIEGMV